jgi:hypothetical protein
MPEKTFSIQRRIMPKPNSKERADEPVTEFEAKLNKWGFIHVPKKAVPSLLKSEEPLKAKIEADALVIRRAS